MVPLREQLRGQRGADDRQDGWGHSPSPARRCSSAAMPASRFTDDYPGEAPYAFTGGTIRQVAVDVSGEPYVDMERQAEMLLRSQ
jgi:hypothetical protein